MSEGQKAYGEVIIPGADDRKNQSEGGEQRPEMPGREGEQPDLQIEVPTDATNPDKKNEPPFSVPDKKDIPWGPKREPGKHLPN